MPEPVIKYDSLMRCTECDVIATHQCTAYAREEFRICTHCEAKTHWVKVGKQMVLEWTNKKPEPWQEHFDDERTEGYKAKRPHWRKRRPRRK
jgi:hypothetical protein